MVSEEILAFPDEPRSELERTIEELVERAQRVLATQGRLRSLLRASRAVVQQLDIETVLERIVEAAVELVDAEYGALGVIAPDGHLERFIHIGMPESEVRLMAHLPEGHGLLGAVVEEGRPIRLDRIEGDPRSAGFPAHHPHMDGFLGVPVRVRDQVFGNLYLTNPRRGAFTQEDEELVTSLAATAGIAIENARLYDESRRRQRWSAALAEVTAALLSEDAEESVDSLGVVADRVAALVDASLVCLVTPLEDGAELLRVGVARGEGAEQVLGRVFEPHGTIVGQAWELGRAVASETGSPADLDWVPALGPVVGVPLTGFGQRLGVLALARPVGAPRFSDADLDMASEFASQASVAIELARARADSSQLQLVEDRSRIARDLHDRVIQRLFAAGLTLQGIAGTLRAPAQERVLEQVDAIDTAISEIRTAVFALTTRGPARASLRHRVLDVVSELGEALPSPPRVTFSGPVDLLVRDGLAEDVVAVVRESLSNVARHARAQHCEVDVAVDDAVVVTITDDGVGAHGSTRSSGTANLAVRARERGGTYEIGTGASGRGTRVRWSAPLPPAAGGGT